MSLILKNTTGSLITLKVSALDIPASGQITIDPSRYHFFQKSDSITETDPLITAGSLVVNDGIRDLSILQSKEYLRFREAFGVPFRSDPTRVNGFIAKDTQTAIEEVRSIANPLIVPINLIYNGTLSNGNFIGYNNLLPGDLTPIIVPISGTFTGFTWSNRDADSDFDLEFRKNTTGGSPFFTWSVTNTKTADVNLGTPETITAGDTFYVKYVDQGSNATDASIVLKFKA